MLNKQTLNNKQKICAVVVTYNRKNMLIECINALRNQTMPIDAIFLIDNASSDDTPIFLKENGLIKDLPPANLQQTWEKKYIITNNKSSKKIEMYYVRMHNNIGGAGGFYEGVKKGYEKGYDWLWLMDDDAEPKPDALEKMLPATKYNDVLVVCNLKVGIDGIIQYKHMGFKNAKNFKDDVVKEITNKELINETVEVDHCSFVGFLVSKSAIEKAGFPRKEFFIHYDDVEYSFRIRTHGKILLISNSVIIHKDGAKKRIDNKKWMGRVLNRVFFDSYWLTYFSIRNMCYLKRKEAGLIYALVTGFTKILRQAIGIILFDDHKLRRIIFVVNAVFDGIRGNFDNYKPKKILYK